MTGVGTNDGTAGTGIGAGRTGGAGTATGIGCGIGTGGSNCAARCGATSQPYQASPLCISLKRTSAPVRTPGGDTLGSVARTAPNMRALEGSP